MYPHSNSTSLSIGFVTTGDARNPRTWSGTVFHMAEALAARGAELSHIGPMETGPLLRERVEAGVRQRLRLRRTTPMRSRAAARVFARQIDAVLRETRPDILFSPAGSALLADLAPGVPAVYSSDATVDLMRDYYPSFARLSRRALAEAETLEWQAIARADFIVYPTEWAAASAVGHYGADPAKVHVVPYGANLAAPERTAALAERAGGPLRLVFIGVNWSRKGGDIAVEALDALNARGINARLTVIGCTPPEAALRPAIDVVPFLDKNNPEDRQKLTAQYLAADFLVLPTRQDCFGIVFCEAAAHGVPSIATATGGVPYVVRDGVGRTLPVEARGAAYADAIEGLLGAEGGMAALRRAARDAYEDRLNWETWSERVVELMRGALAARA